MVPFLGDQPSSFQQRDSTNHLVCWCAFRTTFLQFLVRRMTSVLQEIFLRTPQHFKNSTYNCLCSLPFFQSMSKNIDKKTIRCITSFSSIVLWTFSSFLQCCVSRENFPLEHDWFSIVTNQFTRFWRLRNPTQVCPSLSLSIVDTQECCQDKEPNQRKRIRWLSAA